jgi:hypothetical protein
MFPPFWDPAGNLKDAFNYIFKLLVNLMSVTYDLDGLKIVQWLLGNVLGLLPTLSVLVALAVLPGAILIRKYRLSGATAIAVLLLSSTLTGAWFFLIDTMKGASADLSHAFASIDSANLGTNALNLPSIPNSNPFLDAFLYFGLFIYSANFMYLFIAQAMINVFVEAFGLVLIAMYGLGPRTRRLFSVLVSVALTTMLIGQPLVILILKAGNAIGNSLPAGNLEFVGFITSASMFIAQIVYIALPFLLYRSVHSVMGKLNATVSNLVRSRIENKHKVDAQVAGRVSTSTTNRAQGATGARYKPAMALEARRMAGASASSALLGIAKKGVIAGSNLHPAAKAAVVGLAIVAKGIGSAGPKREKVKTLNDYR